MRIGRPTGLSVGSVVVRGPDCRHAAQFQRLYSVRSPLHGGVGTVTVAIALQRRLRRSQPGLEHRQLPLPADDLPPVRIRRVDS